MEIRMDLRIFDISISICIVLSAKMFVRLFGNEFYDAGRLDSSIYNQLIRCQLTLSPVYRYLEVLTDVPTYLVTSVTKSAVALVL
jgi:hypothetical protein